MSQTLRMQCAVWHDSLSAADAMVINPCFNVVELGTPDVHSLCTDLANGLKGAILQGVSHQIRVRAYDVYGSRPNYMLDEVTIGAGGALPSTVPRELAVVLSFYAGHNAPRHRGRLYIPFAWLTTGTTASVRPASTHMTSVAAFVPVFTGLGGINVDWVVVSSVTGNHEPVTNWWVDDEWDIIRSRGLKPTTRQTGTTTEAGAPNVVALQAGITPQQLEPDA